ARDHAVERVHGDAPKEGAYHVRSLSRRGLRRQGVQLRAVGLEPTHPGVLEPKSSASTNSARLARNRAYHGSRDVAPEPLGARVWIGGGRLPGAARAGRAA